MTQISEKLDLLVPLFKKVGGSPKVLQFIFWEPWISVPNIISIHPIVVETILKTKSVNLMIALEETSGHH